MVHCISKKDYDLKEYDFHNFNNNLELIIWLSSNVKKAN